MLAIAILAGDKKRKALLKINQKTLGEIVLDAIKDIEGYKILVAKKEVLNFYSNYANYFDFINASSFFKNHVKPINKAKARGINEIIFVHCDLPLLNRRSLENFINQAVKENADFIVPVCDVECIKKTLLDYKLWKWKAQDFEFIVGNVYSIRIKENKIRNTGLINLLYKYRNKRSLFNWFFIGFGFLVGENIRLITYIKDILNINKGTYNLDQISKSISKILFNDEGSYKLIKINDPTLYIDIDNKRDFEIVKHYLNNF